MLEEKIRDVFADMVVLKNFPHNILINFSIVV